MAKGRIAWTGRARKDRKELFSYWNKRNKSTAYSLKLNELFSASLQQLIIHPFSGSESGFGEIRFVVVRGYQIFYEVESYGILIIAIWDGRQSPEKLKTRLE